MLYLKERKAVLISALVFGIYHWFSFGMFGSGIVPMIYIFIVPGSMGWVWANIYARTHSIVMPVAIHLAWIFISSLFLDYNPFGELMFTSTINSHFSEMVDFGIQFSGELASVLLIFGMFKYYNKKRLTKISQPNKN